MILSKMKLIFMKTFLMSQETHLNLNVVIYGWNLPVNRELFSEEEMLE